jgi:hypothetical protein
LSHLIDALMIPYLCLHITTSAVSLRRFGILLDREIEIGEAAGQAIEFNSHSTSMTVVTGVCWIMGSHEIEVDQRSFEI